MSITEKDMKLLYNVIKKGRANTTPNIEELKKIVSIDILNSLSKNAPPDFSHLYFNFNQEFQRFLESIYMGRLFDKNIITLAGSFSSGKSSFINSILGKEMLPANINPATSTPTYVVKGDKLKISALNTLNHFFTLTLSDLNHISHSNENDGLEISHMIKNILIETPNLPFENITLIDTPGYSRAKSLDLEEISDEELAEYYLNTSDSILWFTPAEIGSITEKDINLLLKIKKEIPKLIIVSKSDKLTDENLKKVLDNIKTSLDEKAINYTKILTFSKRNSEKYDGELIFEEIEKLNYRKTDYSFLSFFEEFFEKIRNYYDKQLILESRRLYRLHTTITLLEDDFVISNLINLTEEIKENMKQHDISKNQLKKLRADFYSEFQKLGLDITKEDFVLEEYLGSSKYSRYLKIYKEKNGIAREFDIYKEVKEFSNSNRSINFGMDFERYRFESQKEIKNCLNNIELEIDKSGFNNLNYLEVLKSHLLNI